MHTNFQIFKNKFKKEGSTQPDYKISAKEGDKFTDIGACWIKDGKDGTKYMSCKLSENPAPALSEDEKKNIQTLRENAILAEKNKEIDADKVFNDF